VPRIVGARAHNAGEDGEPHHRHLGRAAGERALSSRDSHARLDFATVEQIALPQVAYIATDGALSG
jgi:hypothetical protein